MSMYNETNGTNLEHFSMGELNMELKEYGLTYFDTLFNLAPKEESRVQVFNKDNKNPEWVEEICNRGHKSYLKTPVFDKTVMKSYMFSGENHTEIEKALPKEFEPFYKFMQDSDSKFNQVTINWYENENNLIPMHSDWTDGMIQNHKISVMTLNEIPDESRPFTILSIDSKTKKQIPLTHGKIVTMHEGFQEKYRHGVMSVSNNPVKNRRISISFRQFI